MARVKFQDALAELESIQSNYEKVWKLRYAQFPTILIDIISSSGKPVFTLCLNLENWNFLPPRATLLSLDLRRILTANQVPGAIENPDKPVNHIVGFQNNPRIWFCSPGFYEYHEYYPEDRWELMKDTDQGKITWIVEQACNLVDRTKLK